MTPTRSRAGRPCRCDRLPPPGQPYTTDYCRLCWLFHHDAAYRALWGGSSPAVPSRPRSLPCIHLGEVIDRLGCPCPGRWLRRCGLYGSTTIEHCKSCPDYQEDEGFGPAVQT
jgi:hypothetical protein